MEPSNDVVMQEMPVQEPSAADIQQTIASDLTDPNPPPQPVLPEAQPNGVATEAQIATQPTVQAAVLPRAAPPTAARPASIPPPAPPSTRPEKPVAHGGPTRQYLNQNVTPHLLEGLKHLAMYEPQKPLAWLADFLRDRSKQVEG